MKQSSLILTVKMYVCVFVIHTHKHTDIVIYVCMHICIHIHSYVAYKSQNSVQLLSNLCTVSNTKVTTSQSEKSKTKSSPVTPKELWKVGLQL